MSKQLAGIKIKGDKQLIAKLKAVGSEKVSKRIQRAASTAAIRVVRNVMKQNVPEETGELKKSLTTKVTGKGFSVNAIAGPDINFEHNGRRPGKYDHLANDGYQHADGGTVAGHHYVEKTASEAHADAMAKYESKLAERLDAEATKGVM